MLQAVETVQKNFILVYDHAQKQDMGYVSSKGLLALIGDLVAAQVALNEALDQMRTDLTKVNMRTDRYGIIG